MHLNPQKTHNIGLLSFNGIQILDVTGPAAVFAAANDAVGNDFYKVRILSDAGGIVQSNSTIAIATEAIDEVRPTDLDTLLIVGGDEHAVRNLAASRKVRQWVLQACGHARRYGSICTGAFALAEFGLIDGKRVVTHWSGCADLARLYPRTSVDANALFVQDGQVWTSAGVTTGIDMCLEIVTSDLGAAVANAIAERLVLYARRPGYQSQFSPVLKAQAKADAPFGKLVGWMREHLAEILDVSRLASEMAMSERSFHRKFTSTMGETPAHFVETLRLDQTRLLLSTGISLKEIAARTGYSTAAQLTKAFERRFGMTPLLFRDMHCGISARAGRNSQAVLY